MIFYKSKYLSKSTGVNPARWKRWVREFLPPDPLGGLQSGYARQFNLKDAFRVHLGGYLVHALKFNVSEARTILSDLHGWLSKNGYFQLTVANGEELGITQKVNQRIYIFCLDAGEFGYTIRSIKPPSPFLSDETNVEQYEMALIKTPHDPLETGRFLNARVVGISYLYITFLKQIAAKNSVSF